MHAFIDKATRDWPVHTLERMRCAPEPLPILLIYVPSSHKLQCEGSEGSGKSFAYLKLSALQGFGDSDTNMLMGLEVTNLLGPPAGFLALQEGLVWLEQQVLHYSEEYSLRISQPGVRGGGQKWDPSRGTSEPPKCTVHL